MPFKWNDPIWNQQDPTNGYLNNVRNHTKEVLTKFLKDTKGASGDQGLLEALTNESDEVTIEKGLHDRDNHITVSYAGGTWHVNMEPDRNIWKNPPYHVVSVSQWKT